MVVVVKKRPYRVNQVNISVKLEKHSSSVYTRWTILNKNLQLTCLAAFPEYYPKIPGLLHNHLNAL